ncbi:MAG: hypothetical protein M3O71_21155 [Bacteroidota bacterium]|nr:hypothetical protein [Bacteroidota bacterium]
MRSKLFAEKPERTKLDSGRWVQLLPDGDEGYRLYDVLHENYLGRILFDGNDNWIYDGGILNVDEQEYVAGYINKFQPEMDGLLKSLGNW